jgi:hypothetical protein
MQIENNQYNTKIKAKSQNYRGIVNSNAVHSEPSARPVNDLNAFGLEVVRTTVVLVESKGNRECDKESVVV